MFYIIWIVILILASFAYILADKIWLKLFKIQSHAVTFESANVSLDRLEKWTTWLTGLQSAAIAAMGFLIKGKVPPIVEQNKNLLVNSGFFALLFFGASIILSTWLLSSLPSIQQRLVNSDQPDVRNDIYMLTLFSFVPFRLGRFAGLVHTYFLIGIIFFAIFIFQSLIYNTG